MLTDEVTELCTSKQFSKLLAMLQRSDCKPCFSIGIGSSGITSEKWIYNDNSSLVGTFDSKRESESK